MGGGKENSRPWEALGCRQWARAPLQAARQLQTTTLVPQNQAQDDAQACPFFISLFYSVCRERRINPEHADSGGRAILKVQNLLDACMPFFIFNANGGPFAPRLFWLSGPDTSLAREADFQTESLCDFCDSASCNGVQEAPAFYHRPMSAGAPRTRAHIAENFLNWLSWGTEFNLQELTPFLK